MSLEARKENFSFPGKVGAMTRSEALGIGASMVSSVFAGTAAVATRYVVGDFGPVALALFRYAATAAGLLAVLLLIGRVRIGRRDGIFIGLLGVLQFTVFPILFNLSLLFTTAARGAIALATVPLLTMLIAAMSGNEAITGKKALGACLALVGVAFALGKSVSGETRMEWMGDGIMVLAALSAAAYNALSRPYLCRYPAFQFTAYAVAAGAIALGLGAPMAMDVGKVMASSVRTWAIVGYLSLVCTPMVFVLWTYGLQKSTPTRIAVTGGINPITAVLLATVLLGEKVELAMVGGLCLVLVGILCAAMDSKALQTGADVRIATKLARDGRVDATRLHQRRGEEAP